MDVKIPRNEKPGQFRNKDKKSLNLVNIVPCSQVDDRSKYTKKQLKFERREQLSAHKMKLKTAPQHPSKFSSATRESEQAYQSIILRAALKRRPNFMFLGQVSVRPRKSKFLDKTK